MFLCIIAALFLEETQCYQEGAVTEMTDMEEGRAMVSLTVVRFWKRLQPPWTEVVLNKLMEQSKATLSILYCLIWFKTFRSNQFGLIGSQVRKEANIKTADAENMTSIGHKE